MRAIFTFVYTLYICKIYNERDETMALKAVPKLDDKIAEMYENQTTVSIEASTTPFVDRSDLILQHMNFIAMTNKSFLHLK